MRLGPVDNRLRFHDRLAIVCEQDRHHPLPAQLLDLAAAAGGPLQELRADSEAAGLDHLRLVASRQQRVVGGAAGMLVEGLALSQTSKLAQGNERVENSLFLTFPDPC
jgi:hypothetical protein